MKIIKSINLGMRTNTDYQLVEAKQGDNASRFVSVTLKEGEQVYIPPAGTEARFRCVKPDGCFCDNPAVIQEDGTILLELTTQILAVPGKVRADVVLMSPDGKILSSSTFTILVGEIPRGQDLASTNELLTYSALIEEGRALCDEMRSARENGEFRGDPGPAGPAGHTPVKGVDYYTDADKAEMVEAVKESVEAIPDYWQTALDEGAEAINKTMCAAGRNKSAFLFYSDAHWDYGAKMAPTLLKYLHNHTGMARTFFGGDIVNDEPDDANVEDFDEMSYLWEWRRQLKDLPNHHSVPGNHDNANGKGGLFTEQFVYGYLLAAEESPDIVRGTKGLYYYIDTPAEKTRYLCLDTACKDASALSDDQATFTKESLKSTPEGWHIVVVAHAWYGLDYDQYDKRPVPIQGVCATASSVMAILDNYNSRNGEFADCGGWVEFCIGGHIHYDYDAVTATGIPIILVETDSMHTRGNYTATAGTTTESSVSGIIADYDNHKIHVVRIGRGASREIAVTNYVVSYTNALPLALAADGVSVYNGKGYKENVRWSASGNSESTQAGIYMTGYIPASGGDVIRLKNITMNKANSSTRGCHLHCYRSLTDTDETTHDGGGIEAYSNGVFDADGNLTQFTMEQGNAYFRLQGTYIGDDSIITINEPIE